MHSIVRWSAVATLFALVGCGAGDPLAGSSEALGTSEAAVTSGQQVIQQSTGTAYITSPSDDAIYTENVNSLASLPSLFAGAVRVPGNVDGKRLVARFSGPVGIDLYPGGNLLYVGDDGNHSVRRIDLATNLVSTVVTAPMIASAGGTNGFGVGGVGVDGSTGRAYLGDTSNHVVWMYHPDKGSVTMLAGKVGVAGCKVGTTAAGMRFTSPTTLQVSLGVVKIEDPPCGCVYQVGVDGTPLIATCS